MPAGLSVGDFGVAQQRHDLTEMSDSTGATATRLLGPPRWRLSMSAPQGGLSQAQAALWQTMLLQLRGGVNHLAAWDIVANAPRGTMRGTLTLNGATTAGQSAAISITGGVGQAATTLLAGDWLQVGAGLTGQLVKVVVDATANGSGVISVTVEPPLRTAYSGGTAVTWDKALGHFKMLSAAPGWTYNPGNNLLQGFSIDLLEQWA